MGKLRGDNVLYKLFTNRLILVGLILLFVVTGGCRLYSWNVQRTIDAESAEETPAEDIPVSPFGFGPYPEIPEDYGMSIPWLWDEETLAKLEEIVAPGLKLRGITFEDHLRTSELLSRVAIKLFNEGVEIYGITSLDSNGLFYPSEPNVVYAEWKETTDSNGQVRRYISSLMGGAGLLTMEQRMGYEPIPDWIEVRSYDEGIDPYEFLGLDR